MPKSRTTDRPARAPRVLSFRARLALILGQPQRQRRPTFYATPSATARAVTTTAARRHTDRDYAGGALFVVGLTMGAITAAGFVLAARDAGLFN